MHAATFSGHPVLVAERSYLIARHVGQILENEGATVFRASSVAQALSVADYPSLSAGVLATHLCSEDGDAVRQALSRAVSHMSSTPLMPDH